MAEAVASICAPFACQKLTICPATLITTDPSGPFSKFTALPIQIYQWTARPQQTFLLIAGAAIIVLIILLFILNGFAIYLRNRYARRPAREVS